jgi:hypothetical protein
MDAVNFIRGLRGNRIYPQNLVLPTIMPLEGGKVWFVDGDKSVGTHGGRSWEDAFDETAFTGKLSALNVSAGDVVFVAGRTMAATDTDPISYTTNLEIDVPQVSLIGVSRGRTQGGLPQFKVGATTTSPIIKISAPAVMVANIGVNGAGGTGGGILLNDDGGSTASAFGWSILGCHFKNCVGTTATEASTGGAVMIGANGGAWQGLLAGNRFYKNVGDFVVKGSSGSVPQDIVLQDNVFSDPAASVNCNVYAKGGGDGVDGLQIINCEFPAMPALGGAADRYFDLTGCTGIISGCRFGSITSPTGAEVTFAAGGTGGLLPAAMHIVDCFGETTTTAETGEIFRT